MPAPRLVERVDGEAPTQEGVLEPLAPGRGFVSHVSADCPWPCQKTSGSFLALTGVRNSGSLILTDVTGSVVAAIDLDPWGGETSRSWNSALQPRKFTTYERDSNADDEAMMRRYSRRHGRFDQPDPYDGSYDFTDP